MVNTRIIGFISFFLAALALIPAQEWDGIPFRGSIPEELMTPKRGEAPRYPIDTVIGALGQGEASDEAYSFAKSVAAGLFSGAHGHPALASMNAVLRESYLSALEDIDLRSFRLGGGRGEPDGAVSFMIRFIGRDRGITGELFIRFVTEQAPQFDEEESESEDEDEDGEEDEEKGRREPMAAISLQGTWMFEELILEEARNHEDEQKDSIQRFDFPPYERFF